MLNRHSPYWQAHATCRRHEPLVGETRADSVVVGAGITGLTAAMRLLQAGRSVTVLDAHRVGDGTTGHSTGHLDAHHDHSFQDLVARVGEGDAATLIHARKQAIDHIEQWNQSLRLDARFHRLPAYWYTESNASDLIDFFGREAELARRFGLEAGAAEAVPLPFRTGAAIRLGDQARFSPLRYLCNLASAFVDAGGELFENVRVIDVQPHDDDGGYRVRTHTGGAVSARDVILATHLPSTGLLSLQSRVYPYQSYVIAAEVANTVPDALYWDNAEPYHYTRLADADDPHTLIIGGGDHHTGEPGGAEDAFASLERYARQRYDVTAIRHRWSHEFYETADTLPYIGRVPRQPRLYIATGFSGTGLTWGTFAGLMLSDLILDKGHPCEPLLSPSRFRPQSSAGRIASELMHMAEHFVGDRLGEGEVDIVDNIPPDQGRIMLVRGRRLAVYRDDDGHIHAHSATCTHARCIVHWNNAEKTWDCPCHGGRYDPYGRVIQGPPRHALAPVRTVKQLTFRSVP